MEDFLEDPMEKQVVTVVTGFVSSNRVPDSNETPKEFGWAKSIPHNAPSNPQNLTDVMFEGEFRRFMWLAGRKRWKLQSLVTAEDLSIEKEKAEDEANKLEQVSKKFSMSNTTPTVTQKGETRLILTTLMNKDEVFRMCALAEATGMCLLLIGPPGTGKTKVVIEYAKAWLNKDGKLDQSSFMDKIFILETDEGTKSSEVKGQPDLEELFLNNKFKLNAPITEAEVVILNEIDKAGSNVRNSLLGVMNEKFLFSGKTKIACKWKLLIATCNVIPKEEEGSPFWDRFPLKMTVSRIDAGEMAEYYKKGDKNYQDTVSIQIPSAVDMSSLTIPHTMLNKFLDVGHKTLSDRTLTFVPTFAKAISVIWNMSMEQSLIKTAAIMINALASQDLSNKLKTAEKKNLETKIQTLHSMKTAEQIEDTITEIEGLMAGYIATKKLNADDIAEAKKDIDTILANHSVKQKQKELDDVMAGLNL